MAVIDLSTNKPVALTQGDAVQIANGFQTIQNVINGNLDTNNVSPTAAIKGSQLATGLNGPSGTPLAYTQIIASVTGIVGTTFAGATAVVSAGAFAFDGVTPVWIEFFAPGVQNTTIDTRLVFAISDSGTEVTRITQVVVPSVSTSTFVFGKLRLTPSNASHTYSIVAFTDAGSATVAAGPGTATNNPPAYVLISKA